MINLFTALAPLGHVLYEEETYMSGATHFFHLFVTDVATFAIYLMELLAVIIIVFTTCRAFIKLITKKPYAKIYLLHGQSIGLTFKLGSEIMRTITVRNMDEILQIFMLIVIKACMVLLIDWELKSAAEHDSEDGPIPSAPTARPKQESKPKWNTRGLNIFYKGSNFFDGNATLNQHTSSPKAPEPTVNPDLSEAEDPVL